MARRVRRFHAWGSSLLFAILAALVSGCQGNGDDNAGQADSSAAGASPSGSVPAVLHDGEPLAVEMAAGPPWTQEKCRSLGGAVSSPGGAVTWTKLKDPVEDPETSPPSNLVMRVWTRYHRYSWDYLRSEGAFLGVLYRADKAADRKYNIVKGEGVTCVWVRSGRYGGDDIVLVNANNEAQYRTLFLAMVKQHHDTADGHFEFDSHHIPQLEGFVQGPDQSPRGVPLTMTGWDSMNFAARKRALAKWAGTALEELIVPGPWFPCSQFGCCKVQGS